MRYVLAVLAAPIAAAIYGGGKQFLICVLLSLLLYVPGVIYALKVVSTDVSN